jgi:ATP-dependent exoDNAse (exonuclease V) beta subunit
MRKLRFETVQTYQCTSCGRRFQEKGLPHKKYTHQVIYDALILYHQGFTLDETRKQVNKRFKVNIGVSTIHHWVNEFDYLCPIRSVRDHFSDAESILFRKRFDHENLDYEFMYHSYKMEKKVRSTFPFLYQYLKRFEQGCPDEFFEIGKRCSQPLFDTKVQPERCKNLACDMAGFSVNAARNNYQRHDVVEEFMLVNDTATVACEVPVWYWEKGVDQGVTGHIDLLQVRNDMVYILDYKPDAAKDRKAAGQLYHYAVALSFRARVPFDDMCCAWFDKDDYFEFEPARVKATLKRA